MSDAPRRGYVEAAGRVACVVGLAVAMVVAPTVRRASSAEGPVAFSVRGASHVSEGDAVLLAYTQTLSNIGGGWDGTSTFTAPADGVYYFSAEFVKDAFSFEATVDDVYLYIRVVPSVPGPATTVTAWSGQNSGKRELGAVSTVVYLTAGSEVYTEAHSDGIPPKKRHLKRFYFTGALVG